MAILAVGHRGAPREFPANTLKGFARAFSLGCPMVECDVRVSADNALVLAHDGHVTDADGKRWDVAEHSASVLADLNLGAGEGVPTLEELVAWAETAGAAVMADMKAEGGGVEERVARALSLLPPARKIVPGAGPEGRRRLRASDPNLPLSLSLGRRDVPDDAAFARLLPGIDTQAVTWEWPLLTAERIAALKDRGFQVFAWTVDDPEVMRRLIADGADAIISNRSDVLTALLRGG